MYLQPECGDVGQEVRKPAGIKIVSPPFQMALDADRVQRRTARTQTTQQCEQGDATVLEIAALEFHIHLVEHENGARVGARGGAKRGLDVARSHALEKNRVAQAVRHAVLDAKRLVDHVPRVEPAGIAAADGAYVMVQRGAEIVRLREPARKAQMPDQIVAAHAQAGGIAACEQRVGAAEVEPVG